jgi:type VI secretion system secreted protein VgrG
MSEAGAAGNPKTGLSGLKVDDAVKYLDDNAEDASTGKCARYVRLAIEAGGIHLNNHPIYAKNYGPTLEAANFVSVPVAGYTPEKGDVIVIQNYQGGHVAGHIAMYDGTQWVSDFKQRDFWAGPGYRQKKPSYKIYRP